jgi:hypothetical protein
MNPSHKSSPHFHQHRCKKAKERNGSLITSAEDWGRMEETPNYKQVRNFSVVQTGKGGWVLYFDIPNTYQIAAGLCLPAWNSQGSG